MVVSQLECVPRTISFGKGLGVRLSRANPPLYPLPQEKYHNLPTFAEQFSCCLERRNLSASRLAKLVEAQGFAISRRTLYRWQKDSVKHPRHWLDIVQVAFVLHLSEIEVNALLQAAGFQAIADLRQHAPPDQALLFQFWNVPMQEVAPLAHFVGRVVELEQLERLLLSERGVKVCVLVGMGGVGKTTLAAEVAHRLRDRFPDGVLWANVGASNMMALLDTFARAYGQNVSQYAQLDDRSRIVRDILARKRVLVILDDVADDKSLQLLLPATGACAVLVTTRRTDLWSLRHVDHVHLRPFSVEHREVQQLFSQILGAETYRVNEAYFQDIAQLVGYLPLALDIVAHRLVRQPGWSVARFLAYLQQEKKRLDLLAYGADVSLRASFNVSYEALPASLQRFFKELGVFAGGDFGVEAAAFVHDVAQSVARDSLTRLYSLSLLQLGQQEETYTLHPLLQLFAREKIVTEMPYARMVAYFVQYAVWHETDYEALTTVYGHLEVALTVAGERPFLYPELIRGGLALVRFWEARGLWETAVGHFKRMVLVAKALNDITNLAAIQRCLGRLAVRQGNLQQAESVYAAALTAAFASENEAMICALKQGLGALAARRGDLSMAAQWSQEALTLACQLGDSQRILELRTNLGGMLADQGQLTAAKCQLEEALVGVNEPVEAHNRRRVGILFQNLGRIASDLAEPTARHYFEQAWALAEADQDQERLCGLLDKRGEQAYLRGELETAGQLFGEGLKIARRLKSPRFICRHLANQAVLLAFQQQFAEAHKLFGQAWPLAQQMGSSWDMCLVLTRWGHCYVQEGMWDEAVRLLGEAQARAETADFPEWIARSAYGLAQALAGQGDWNAAREQGQRSAAIFMEMGHRLASVVQTWLKTSAVGKTAEV